MSLCFITAKGKLTNIGIPKSSQKIVGMLGGKSIIHFVNMDLGSSALRKVLAMYMTHSKVERNNPTREKVSQGPAQESETHSESKESHKTTEVYGVGKGEMPSSDLRPHHLCQARKLAPLLPIAALGRVGPAPCLNRIGELTLVVWLWVSLPSGHES